MINIIKKKNTVLKRISTYCLLFAPVLSLAAPLNIGARTVASTPIPEQGGLFASVNGSGEDCSELNPCEIQNAFSKLEKGTVLFLRGGNYNLDKDLFIGKKGTKNEPIIVESYPGERAILNGNESVESVKENQNVVRVGIKIAGGEHVSIRNLEIKNMGAKGIFILYSSHNTVEGCNIHDNFLTGIHVYGGDPKGSEPYEYGYNTIQDNIVYNNSDTDLEVLQNDEGAQYSYESGDNADGISISSGHFNKVIHNTLYANSDDGIDTWRSNDTYVAYNLTYDNGRGTGGNGNGIKAGGNLDKNALNGSRTLAEYNISYNNKRNGFDFNSGKDVVFRHNTSYENQGYGFTTGENSTIESNIAVNNLKENFRGKIGSNNSWNIGDNIRFKNVEPQDSSDFLKPLKGSAYENIGANVGRSDTILTEKPDTSSDTQLSNEALVESNNFLFTGLIKPTSIAPQGEITETLPSYQWTAVANATSYTFGMEDSLTETGWHEYTITSAEANCTDITQSCTYTPQETLSAGDHVVWWVKALNIHGETDYVGNGMEFNVVSGDTTTQGGNSSTSSRVIPTAIAPQGETTELSPHYQWTAVENATSYTIGMEDALTETGWHEYTMPSAEANCTDITQTCTYIPQETLSIGNHVVWWVKALNMHGETSYVGDGMEFNVVSSGTPEPGITQGGNPASSTNPLPVYNHAYQQKFSADKLSEIIINARNAYVLLDPFEDNVAAKISEIKNNNNEVSGYISAGTGEDWRSDYAQILPYLSTTQWEEWAGESFVSQTTTGILDVMKARIDKMSDWGLDWVEFDNMDWLDESSRSDFNLEATVVESKEYINKLCDHTRSKGMKCMAKNTVDGFEDFEGVTYESFHDNKDWWDKQGTKDFLASGKLVIIIHYMEDDCDGVYRFYKNAYSSENISFICEDNELKKYKHYNLGQ